MTSTHEQRVTELVDAEYEDAKRVNPYLTAREEDNMLRKKREDEGMAHLSHGMMQCSPTNSGENDRSLDEAISIMEEWKNEFYPGDSTTKSDQDMNQLATAAIEKIRGLGVRFWRDFRGKYGGNLGLNPSQTAIAFCKYHIATLQGKSPYKKHLFTLSGFGLNREIIEVSYTTESSSF